MSTAILVDLSKHKGKPHALENFRLVVQNFNAKRCFLQSARNVQRASVFLLLSLSVSENSVEPIPFEVSEADVSSEPNLLRFQLVNSSKILSFPDNVLFNINLLLCGLPNARNQWFLVAQRYDTHDLELRSSV